MDVRVVNVLSTGTGDIIDVVATLNYAGASSSQTGGPFACISQRMYTWSTYSDGEGIMEVAQNQEGVEITQCTDGTAPNVGCVFREAGTQFATLQQQHSLAHFSALSFALLAWLPGLPTLGITALDLVRRQFLARTQHLASALCFANQPGLVGSVPP